MAPERLREVTRTEVQRFVSEYEMYSQSAEHTTQMRALITENAKKQLTWQMKMKRHAQVKLPAIPDVREGEENLEDYLRDYPEAEEALSKLLLILTEPASKAHAQDALNDHSLALQAGLTTFEHIGERVGNFAERAEEAMNKGTSETVVLRAFTDVFLKNYPFFSKQVKAEKPTTLEEAQNHLAGLAHDLDQGAQRVRNFDMSNKADKCFACQRTLKRRVKDRLTHTSAGAGQASKEKGKRNNPDKQNKDEEMKVPFKRQKSDKNYNGDKDEEQNPKKEPYACLGCGKGEDDKGKRLCTFYRCEQGPWLVGPDYKIRHQTDNTKQPHREIVPKGLRQYYKPDRSYGGNKHGNERSDSSDSE